ncbi:MAG: cardiolipin synthase [Burkholderiaceae bacterium]
MAEWGWSSALAIAIQVALIVGVTLRVILTRHPPGSSFAWILLTVALPYVGFGLYLMMGERPIGRLRARRMRAALERWPTLAARLPASERADLDALPALDIPLARLATRLGQLPLTAGSSLELMADTGAILKRLISDIDAANARVQMAFYIWNEGGAADQVAHSLIAAAQRGVHCRLLLDAIGSKPFLASHWPRLLRQAGVEIAVAMKVRLWEMAFVRADLRLHRKIVVIDGQLAYTGSMNLVDPRYFKQDAGVGEWVDAMARIEGPTVGALETVFLYDWTLQSAAPAPTLADSRTTEQRAGCGSARVVVVPSGPTSVIDANRRLIIEAINRAEQRILLTTPYFVPGEPLTIALQNAALRGVEVRLLVPEKNDSRLVQYASRRYFDDLLSTGVKVLLFRGGLLHTKSITVDQEFALFGTVNLDTRSLHLNFELTLLVFDLAFTRSLVALQESYEAAAVPLEANRWRQRPLLERFKEGACFLVSPLL